MTEKSALQIARAAYQAKLPSVFKNGANVALKVGEPTTAADDAEQIQQLFPTTYGAPILAFEGGEAAEAKAINAGVILSGGQAPGGHNVIAGLFDGLKSLNSDNKLYGFLGGPGGLVDNAYMELTSDIIDEYRNTGGFDIIGSGRTKLEETEQFDTGLENMRALDINALIIIGGDDSNTNACVLAEYYKSIDAGVQVVGCPKTIDGDLKNEYIETSFGFDTACKVYSELIGNIARDAMSAKKYWHFIKVMGRSASHIALECGLQTQANITLVSEEVEAKKQTLGEIVSGISDVIAKRAEKSLDFGLVVIPEGLIEFVPEMKALISELNDLLAHDADGLSKQFSSAESTSILEGLGLTAPSAAVYFSLPGNIREQLVMDRDPHGNVQVSRIETEKLLIGMVEVELAARKASGSYNGSFSAQNHFFGYEGRCAAPSNFDADYCYSLGYGAAALLGAGKTAYLSSVRNLTQPADQWIAGGIPLTSMMNVERRHGQDKPVIRKALVELDGAPFGKLAANREKWGVETSFIYPGPIQYFGPSEVCDQPSKTIVLEQEG
ncbi:MAG: diphosphate--fructose-6-phosphate 1-phosphotransferase [Lentisphaeraceae bacterium]|nr:diphosphate--fructose-6-phosphate 1-phosphotransferase [Lentisphaeraceae bacterium]